MSETAKKTKRKTKKKTTRKTRRKSYLTDERASVTLKLVSEVLGLGHKSAKDQLSLIREIVK